MEFDGGGVGGVDGDGGDSVGDDSTVVKVALVINVRRGSNSSVSGVRLAGTVVLVMY